MPQPGANPSSSARAVSCVRDLALAATATSPGGGQSCAGTRPRAAQFARSQAPTRRTASYPCGVSSPNPVAQTGHAWSAMPSGATCGLVGGRTPWRISITTRSSTGAACVSTVCASAAAGRSGLPAQAASRPPSASMPAPTTRRMRGLMALRPSIRVTIASATGSEPELDAQARGPAVDLLLRHPVAVAHVVAQGRVVEVAAFQEHGHQRIEGVAHARIPLLERVDVDVALALFLVDLQQHLRAVGIGDARGETVLLVADLRRGDAIGLVE